MIRNHHSPPELPVSAINGGSDGGSDQSSNSIRDRSLFKRNPNCNTNTPDKSSKSPLDRSDRRSRWHYTNRSYNRKGWLLPCLPFRGVYLFYCLIFFSVLAFVLASILLQSSITGMAVFGRGWIDHRRPIKEDLKSGAMLKFVPVLKSRLPLEGHGLDHVRLLANRVGLRPPRLAVILGNMKKGPQSLMLISVVMNLRKLGYALKIYAVDNGVTRSVWEEIGGRISILGPEQYDHIDWSIFEAVIVDSLEAKGAVSSLTQEPFQSIPLVWIIQEDTLANRLPLYQEMGWQHLLSHWRSIFNRANVVVFPDFTLPMLYTVLDTGNFFVIPGSPVDVWAAESYSKTHAKHQLRVDHGFSKDDLVVLVVGSSFFYDELSWDYAVAVHTLGPLLAKYARTKDAEGSFKLVFLGGNSTDDNALQEVVSGLGLHHGSVWHYGLHGDVNSVLLMADVVLYGSSQNEQGFPPLLIRAMTFGTPVIAPDIPILKKYVDDGAHGILFSKYSLEALTRALSLLISNGKLSKFAQTLAFSGRLLAKNMLASECIIGYARLLENLISFPSDTLLPGPVSNLQRREWEWNLFSKELEQEVDDLLSMAEGDFSFRETSAVYSLEKEWSNHVNSTSISGNGTEILVPDIPTESDWDVLSEIESFEEYERVETEELQERMDKSHGPWDEIYRDARKSEKLKFEANERDEGELERTGQPVCIYEIYDGAGAWPFLRKSGKAAKDPNKPKRPASAFFVFMEEFREQYKREHPKNKSVAAVGKAGGDKWKSLSEAEKAPFVAKADKRKVEYEKKMKAYNKEQAEGPKEEEESAPLVLFLLWKLWFVKASIMSMFAQIRPEWEQGRKRSRMDDILPEDGDQATFYLPGIRPRTPLHKELRVFLEEEQKASEAGLSANEESKHGEIEEELKQPEMTIMKEEHNKSITPFENEIPIEYKLRALEIGEGKRDKIQFPVIQDQEIEDEESRKQRGKGNVERWLQLLLENSGEEIEPQNSNGSGANTSDDIVTKLNQKFPQKEAKSSTQVQGEMPQLILQGNDKGTRVQEIVEIEPNKTPKEKGNGSVGGGEAIGSSNSFEGKERIESKKERVLTRSESARTLRRIPSSPSLILGMRKGVECMRKKPMVTGDDDYDGDRAAGNSFIKSSIKTIKKAVKF